MTKAGVEVTHMLLPNAGDKAERVTGCVCCSSLEGQNRDEKGQKRILRL